MRTPRYFRTRRYSFITALLLAAAMLPGLGRAQALIKYITPDAGAPGMTVAVEILGDANATQPFGADSAYYYDLVQLTDPHDTTRVVVGPQVVSWSGRMIQFMLFIKPEATIGGVGLTVKGGLNSTSFSIVDPLDLGVLTTNMTLVAGQSRRNTIVVDSLVLMNGTFKFPFVDTDPSEPGNQAYLPARVLSVGPIRLINATIDISGSNGATGSAGGNGGPGGGGGGGGMPGNGGSGFTGGGGVGEQSNHNLRHGGEGTGASGSHYYDGGSSLNGVAGGQGTEHGNPLEGNDEGGGGGTGHPFGSSGSHGLYKLDSPPGGHGGGSAGGTSTSSGTTNYAGGGGGYETQGAAGVGTGDNGGLQVGSAALIPLAGGSGGGAGNVSYAFAGAGGSGGGGGGAVDMTSFSRFEFVSGLITAHGGNGSNGQNGIGENGAGGGGGSGGAIVIGARDSVIIGSSTSSPVLDVNGGSGGGGYKTGGSGGVGHVRVDGPITAKNGNADISYFSRGRDFIGAAVQRVTFTPTTFTAVGSCGDFDNGGWQVEVLYHFPSDPKWYSTVVVGTLAPGQHTATWSVGPFTRPTTPMDSVVYVVATTVEGKGNAPYQSSPIRAMAHVGGIIAKPLKVPASVLSTTVLDFGIVPVGACKDSFVVISNSGTAPLIITQETIGDVSFTITDALPITIAPSAHDTLHVRFCPPDETKRLTSDDIVSNAPESPQTLTLVGQGKKYVASATVSPSVLDFGLVRVGTCKDSFVVVKSDGDVPLVITAETIGDARFSYTDALPKTIAAGTTDTLHLRFCPRDTMRVTSTDTIQSNATQSPQAVTLIGQGKKAILSVDAVLDFGNVPKGFCRDSSMYVRNVGNDSLVITDEIIANPKFTALAPRTPVTVAPHDSVLFIFQYCSSDTGVETSAGTVVSNDTGHFTLRAHTSLATLQADSVIDFGCAIVNVSRTGKAYIRNVGNTTVTGVTVSAAASEPLRIISSPLSDIAAHATDSISVEFTPTSTGDYTGTVHVQWTPSEMVEGSSTDIVIKARVTNPPKIEVVNTVVDFGVVPVDQQSGDSCITITNYSCEALTADTYVLSGSPAFRVTSSSLPTALVDSGRTTICVAFTPTRNGPDSAYIRFISGTDTSSALLLKGFGLAPLTNVVLALDTVYGRPGDVVTMRARVVNDVSIAGITSITFRINYDRMQLDLRTPTSPGTYATNPTVTDLRHATGDDEITVTSTSPLTGTGVIAELPFEILLPTANVANVSIASATFGTSHATLSQSAPGQVIIAQCDTTERIQIQPSKIDVAQNSPNPFNPQTSIRIDVHEEGYVTVRVLNILGEQIATPFTGPLSEGTHAITLNADSYPSGIYRYVVDWTDGTSRSTPIAHWMNVAR